MLSKIDVDSYGPIGSGSWLLSGCGVMILVIIRLQLAILFCFAFFLLLAGASLEGVLH